MDLGRREVQPPAQGLYAIPQDVVRDLPPPLGPARLDAPVAYGTGRSMRVAEVSSLEHMLVRAKLPAYALRAGALRQHPPGRLSGVGSSRIRTTAGS